MAVLGFPSLICLDGDHNSHQAFNRLPFIAIGAGSLVLALVLALLLSTPLLALGVLAAGGLGVLGVYRSQQAKMTTALTYELDAETSARFDGI